MKTKSNASVTNYITVIWSYITDLIYIWKKPIIKILTKINHISEVKCVGIFKTVLKLKKKY